MGKELRRQDITFEQKDQPLRDDVRILGTLVGDLLKDQGGQALFEIVESARLRSIRRREGNEKPGEELADLVSNLDSSHAIEVIRAFSTYFQMVNTAEKVHRIRRRRAYLQEFGQYQPGGLEETLVKLKAAGLDLASLKKLFSSLRIEPVFTAHPTEPTRRTILRKEQNIVRRLIDMLDPTLTAQETFVCLQNIRLEMTTGWQTNEHPSEQMTVADELEHVLFFMTDVLYRAMPPFYEDIENAIGRVYGVEGQNVRVPAIVRFSSWVGGDMDGNPNVNAKTIRSTLARQRSLILDLYYRECRSLSAKLSQSSSRVGVDERILRKIEIYRGMFQHAYHAVPARHREMPYRVFLKLVQARLQATYDDEAYPYESAKEFRADIRMVAASLTTNHGEHAGLFSVRRLLRRIETFGFHFMTLDIRQDALVLRKVVGELLGEEGWLDMNAADRLERIVAAIRARDSVTPRQSVLARKTLAVFQAIAFCLRKYGKRAIGPFIISMTEGADDVLSVLLLANWSELHNRRDEVPLDVVPLLETVDDLEAGTGILREMLGNELYREHLRQRGDRQTVMIGYSDSNKDAGLASARWALQNAQIELVEAMKEQGVELHLFHGRGGTISRGGGKTHTAVLGAPPGTVNGHLR
ncbi:MAG: phosphoenolpyruvate carboxylase, partial [Gammaproteobacteria bacterium]|nr:phosphoenolpyruvate carboxylase [Gammaproteobacteria bacterium]